MNLYKRFLLAIFLMLATVGVSAAPRTFQIGDGTFLLDGKPFVVKAAELHYPRIPRPYWEHRIQMCRALGMNAVCLYVFWNIHEQKEGEFDFTGQNDVAEFCRLAQKNGMYVIVRPGPYVCAEWEMGGLPWWLLKKKDIRLREQDPYFMERVRIFEQKVGEQLAPLTIQNGGPIIMIQVENEYGSYGEDKAYVSEIRDCLREVYGDKMTLFQCDWASNFTKNGLDDLVWTMNFGTGANIDEQFRLLGELRPTAPKMCSEFWSGWFDKWGAQHETRPADQMVQGIDEMLSKGISFSLYMTHGGTSFGHWAGANSPGFQPDVTSYDYDAPINEWGHATDKYYLLRETLQKYSDKKLPSVPKKPAPLISVPKFSLKEHSPLMNGVDAFKVGRPLTFEEMDMGWGTMVYMADLPETSVPTVLTLDEAHDYAQVFINGNYIGKIDRVENERNLRLPPIAKGSVIQIVVEGMGRINFGRAIKDYKGICGNISITLDDGNMEQIWKIKRVVNLTIPDSYETAMKAFEKRDLQQAKSNNLRGIFGVSSVEDIRMSVSQNTDLNKCGYYRGTFTLKKTGDTFLNMDAFGKGQVWINGHAIGRFWNIGPQQTLYVPGCWLKKGRNEVVVLDLVGPKGEPVAYCQDLPLLDNLNKEKSAKHDNPVDRPDLDNAVPSFAGSFAPGNGWQTIHFSLPQRGRFLAIEINSVHGGGDVAAIAEIYLQDVSGKRIGRESWKAKYADSENESGNHMLDKMFDLQESTYWQSYRKAALPHLVVIDLGEEVSAAALEYLPRAEQGAPGSVCDYRIFIY